MKIEPIWPWAEANQGLFTILSFAAASTIAVVEIIRAIGAETRSMRVFCRALSRYLEKVWRATHSQLDVMHLRGSRAHEPWEAVIIRRSSLIWHETVETSLATVMQMKGIMPTDADLAVVVASVELVLSQELKLATHVTIDELEVFGARIEDLWGKVVNCAPWPSRHFLRWRRVKFLGNPIKRRGANGHTRPPPY